MVSFEDDGEVEIGEKAIHNTRNHADRVIYNSKQLFGIEFTDQATTKYIKNNPFMMVTLSGVFIPPPLTFFIVPFFLQSIVMAGIKRKVKGCAFKATIKD